MAALITLLQAVQNDARADIDAFFAALKQESANTRLEELSAIYHFKTFCDAQVFDGNRVMLAQDLAQLMYDTSDISGPRHLLLRYDLPFYGLEGSGYDIQSLLKRHFDLSRYTSQQSFATYAHFLMAGMKGDTPLAQKVCAYLLAMEEQGRMVETLQIKQENPIEILRRGWESHHYQLLAQSAKIEEHDQRIEHVEHVVVQFPHQLNAERTERLRYQQQEARRRKSRSEYFKQVKFPNHVTARFQEIWQGRDCMYPGCDERDIIRRKCFQWDHVVPSSKGGTNHITNLGLICQWCNNEKRDHLVPDYRPVSLVNKLREQDEEWQREDAARAQQQSTPLFEDCCLADFRRRYI